MKDKKGQIGNLVSVMTVLIVTGLLIVSGFIILQEFAQQDNLFDGQSVTNETEAHANTTGYTVDEEEGERTKSFVLTQAYNGSSGEYNETVPLTDLTINSVTGVITNATTKTYSNLSVSYTYDKGTDSWKGLNSTIEATTTIPNLLGLLILIIIIGIVLGVVFNVIPTGKIGGA